MLSGYIKENLLNSYKTGVKVLETIISYHKSGNQLSFFIANNFFSCFQKDGKVLGVCYLKVPKLYTEYSYIIKEN